MVNSRMLAIIRLPEVEDTRRNFGLDSARALAISAVLLSHGAILLPRFPAKPLLFNGGFFGVELFFVLSGFLIGSILIELLVNQAKISSGVLLNFWTRRWL